MPTVDGLFPAALAKRIIRDDFAGMANDDSAGAHTTWTLSPIRRQGTE